MSVDPLVEALRQECARNAQFRRNVELALATKNEHWLVSLVKGFLEKYPLIKGAVALVWDVVAALGAVF